MSLEPRDKRLGTKTERHTCPTCKTPYNVDFECVDLAGEVDCSAVSVR